MVDCFGLKGSLRYYSVYISPSPREREREREIQSERETERERDRETDRERERQREIKQREIIDQRKNVQTIPSRTSCKYLGLYSTNIQSNRTPRYERTVSNRNEISVITTLSPPVLRTSAL